MTDAQRRVVAFVQAHPRLLAALYDLDLTPDETVFNALWPRTVRIAALYAEAAGLEPPWLVAEATAPTSADPQHASMSIAEIESRQRVSDGLIRDHDAGEHDMMGEDRREAGRRLLARALMFASMTDEDSPERFGNGFEARAWADATARPPAVLTDGQQRVSAFVREHPPLLDALYDLDLTPEQTCGTDSWPKTVRVVALYARAAGIEPPWLVAEANATRREASPAGVRATAPRRDADVPEHTHDADALIGAGAVYVAPDGPAGERAGEPMRRLACGCVLRFELVEACAAEAERFEREALGSPIAQDAARQIRLAILALR